MNVNIGSADGIRMSSRRKLRIGALLVLGIALAAGVLSVASWLWRSEVPMHSPPDLSSCTRIEFRHIPAIFGYPVWKDEAEKNLLTCEEVQHVEMLLSHVVDDTEGISGFARMIASGAHAGPAPSGAVATKTVASVLCHFPDRPVLRVTVYGDSTVIVDGQSFRYKTGLGIVTRIHSQVRSSELLPRIQLRIQCVRNLGYLHAGLREFANEDVVYPSASTWCDAVIERYVDQGDAESQVRKHLECPAVRGSPCNYAMNPHCRPDSPEDTVLLFESVGGWNRSGGPELFTFDNHNPPGGLVLLNDGTVKFIRTDEELKQLRWK